jgi:GT2 family glycosyltransferase|tara:strand:- start:1458 stop:2123 length:666 start_codon:yes stop_codon:yes gene_type:complete
MIKTMIFSASAGKETDTTLFKTTQADPQAEQIVFKENNKQSLHKVYNKAIDFALQEDVERLVLVHDDVILESYSERKLDKLFKKFDVIGCAGTTEVNLKLPALWHLMGGGFGSGNLHGAVAHGDEERKHMTAFGEYPKRVVLLDGVFLAIHRRVFEKIRFDEDCPSKWHFYDLDYSMQCHKAGFKLGVGDILITHNSPGLTSFTDEFNKGQEWFLDKWKTK